ncbi:MAG: hypothetical protein A4E58_01496 [Syntrophorhabdus sp. PtaB.Bin006]|nr:MAG: hypothetical protein A4E58_01496 [Syntrophorhabdus sp. PtaB.Bin006]
MQNAAVRISLSFRFSSGHFSFRFLIYSESGSKTGNMAFCGKKRVNHFLILVPEGRVWLSSFSISCRIVPNGSGLSSFVSSRYFFSSPTIITIDGPAPKEGIPRIRSELTPSFSARRRSVLPESLINPLAMESARATFAVITMSSFPGIFCG